MTREAPKIKIGESPCPLTRSLVGKNHKYLQTYEISPQSEDVLGNVALSAPQ